jgi:hypothetical protein
VDLRRRAGIALGGAEVVAADLKPVNGMLTAAKARDYAGETVEIALAKKVGACGQASAGVPPNWRESMEYLGENTGLASFHQEEPHGP